MFKNIVLLLSLIVSWPVSAQNCIVPALANLAQAPALQPEAHTKLTRSISTTIDMPIEKFRTWFYKAPLEQLLPGTSKLPAVLKTEAIGELAFPAESAKRYVCLADGNGAIEKVVSLSPERFSYLVFDYTVPEAKPIKYGYGEFVMTANGDSTNLSWSYSFLLKEDTFPGWLGPIGRFLFRISFLDSTYAEFMSVGMEAIKTTAEKFNVSSMPLRK